MGNVIICREKAKLPSAEVVAIDTCTRKVGKHLCLLTFTTLFKILKYLPIPQVEKKWMVLFCISFFPMCRKTPAFTFLLILCYLPIFLLEK